MPFKPVAVRHFSAFSKYTCIFSFLDVDEDNLAKFFADHKAMAKSEPDFTGVRVKKYSELMELATNLTSIHTIFVEEESFPEYFPAHFDRTAIVNLRFDCGTSDSRSLFTNAKSFQKQAVRKWNPHADDIVPTMFLGLNAIDE
jgi:hypothetical protein